MSAGKVIVMPIDKPQSRKKYYLAVFNSEQLCQVLYVYSPEEVLTLASQYQALGYRVEEGVVSGRLFAVPGHKRPDYLANQGQPCQQEENRPEGYRITRTNQTIKIVHFDNLTYNLNA